MAINYHSRQLVDRLGQRLGLAVERRAATDSTTTSTNAARESLSTSTTSSPRAVVRPTTSVRTTTTDASSSSSTSRTTARPATTSNTTTTARAAHSTTSTTSSSSTPSTAARAPITHSTSSISVPNASISTGGISSTASSSSDSSSSSSTKSSSSTGIIIGVVIAVLAVLAIVAFFGYRYRKKKQALKGEDEQLFPYAGGPNAPGSWRAGGGDTNTSFGAIGGPNRNSGYRKHVDDHLNVYNSYDDLMGSNHDTGNEYEKYGNADGGRYGAIDYTSEKPMSGMAGNGVLGGVGEANVAGANMTHSLLGRDARGNFAPLSPGSYLSSPSLVDYSRPGSHGGHSYHDSMNETMPGYPPSASSISVSGSGAGGRGPQAAMMRNSDAAIDSTGAAGDHLPAHQDLALMAAMDAAVVGGIAAAGSKGARRASGQSANTNIAEMRGSVTSQNSGSAGYFRPNSGSSGGHMGSGSGKLTPPGAMSDKMPLPAIAKNAASATGAVSPPAQGAHKPFTVPASEGEIYIVTRTFEPSMEDELVIFPGDRIQIFMTYDDGWCLGVNLDSRKRDGLNEPKRGVFPTDCVEKYGQSSNSTATSGTKIANVAGKEQQLETLEEKDENSEQMDDVPLNSGPTELERAPTLPPLEMGEPTSFTIDASSENRASQISKRNSKDHRQSVVVLQEEEDAYGGLTTTSPINAQFPPNDQNTSHSQPLQSPIRQHSNYSANPLMDEFPTSPQTATSAESDKPSPKIMPFAVQSENPNTLSVSSRGISKSSSAGRTSSLVARQGAIAFLPNAVSK